MSRRILALIPARGGSKRLPNKNLLPLAGKPLLAWSIEAAKACPEVESVVVSTDSEEIAATARLYGAETPFLRPEALATDTASSLDVILHCIEYLAARQQHYDALLLLQPTSPLRRPADISAAIELFYANKAYGVISVSECEHSPLWANTLPDSLSLQDFISDEIKDLRSQDLPAYYRFNGAIYLYSIQELLRRRSLFYSPKVYALTMAREDSVDIDTPLDFQFAELLAKVRSKA